MVAEEDAPEGGQTADHTGKVRQDSSDGMNLAITGAVRDVNIGQSSEPQVASQAVVRKTLPGDVAEFTGRDEELRRLTEAVTTTATADGPVRAVSIHAINGMAGIGKSALAVHAARQMADRFPDGQLFVPLHAHTPGQRPAQPADALASLLLASGVEAQAIPVNLDDRAALWRDRMADRKMLLVLDDAAGAAQVRPLLPASAVCLVLITSRRRLVDMPEVQPLELNTLPPDKAAELFVRLAGERRHDPEPDAVEEVVRLCGYLPLAIGLSASRLRNHPTWSVRYLVRMLTATQDRLSELRAGDVKVEAAFELSYQGLPADIRLLFRRLGLHPGTDLERDAAAALADISPDQATSGLEVLYDHHLLTEPLPGRYAFHDLLATYARKLADGDDPEDRAQAVGRLLDHYLRRARAADDSLRTYAADPSAADAPRGSAGLDTREAALEWLEADRANLVACVGDAATRQPSYAVSLAAAMGQFLGYRGSWEQAPGVHETALAAARLLNDRGGQANALTDLASVQRLAGEWLQANENLTEALNIYRDLGNQLGQANALQGLGMVRYLELDNAGALEALTQALNIHRNLGNQLGEATALYKLGLARDRTNERAGATETLTEALALFRNLGDRRGVAIVLKSLGRMRSRAGDHPGATEALTQALTLSAPSATAAAKRMRSTNWAG